MRDRLLVGALAFVLTLGIAFPAPVHAATDFKDVEPNHWAAESIAFAVEKGIVTGYYDSYSNIYTFAPDRAVSYEEAATMLWRALTAAGVIAEHEGEAGDYTAALDAADIAAWARPYVTGFLDLGIIEVKDLAGFVGAEHIGNPAPRATVAVWTAKALGRPLAAVYYLPYTDRAQINASDRPYIDMLYRQSIMKGSLQLDGSVQFQPASGVKRSEFAAIANRVYENQAGKYDYRNDCFSFDSAADLAYLYAAPEMTVITNGTAIKKISSGSADIATYVKGNVPFVLSGMGTQLHIDFQPAAIKGSIASIESLDTRVFKVGITVSGETVYYIQNAATDTTGATMKKGQNVKLIADGTTITEITNN